MKTTEVSPSNIGAYIRLSTFSSVIILAAMSVLAIGFICWCFFGSVTDREHIRGVVFPSTGTNAVSVPNDGAVREVLVHKGDYVEEGQTLALISVAGSYSILSAPYSGKVLSYIAENSSFNAFEGIVNLLPENTSGTVTSMVAFAGYNPSRMMKVGMEIQATPMSETREKIGFVKGRIVSISPYPVSRREATVRLQNQSMVDEIFPDEASVFEIEIELETEPDNPGSLLWSFPQKEVVDMSVGTFCNVEVITKSRSIFRYLLENVQETRNTVRLWGRK